MRNTMLLVLLVALLAAAVVVAGCKGSSSTTSVAPVDPGGGPGGAAATGSASAPAASDNMASCPVLGTTMEKSKMVALEHDGKTYYFCCQDCVDKFKKDPQKYIDNPAKPLPPGAPMPADDE